MKAVASAVAIAAAFVYALGYEFGRWIHQLNDDVTALFTGHILLSTEDYILKLRLRRLSYRAIAKKVGCTEYHVRKTLRK